MTYPTPIYAGLTVGAANVIAPPVLMTSWSRGANPNLLRPTAHAPNEYLVDGEQSHIASIWTSAPRPMFQNRYWLPPRRVVRLCESRKPPGIPETASWIFHQAAPDQRHKQDAKNAAHHHQRRRLPIGVSRIEGGPGPQSGTRES